MLILLLISIFSVILCGCGQIELVEEAIEEAEEFHDHHHYAEKTLEAVEDVIKDFEGKEPPSIMDTLSEIRKVLTLRSQKEAQAQDQPPQDAENS